LIKSITRMKYLIKLKMADQHSKRNRLATNLQSLTRSLKTS